MNHSFCVGRERRNPDVGQVAIPEGSSSVFSVGSVFSLLHAGFSPRLSVENRLDPLYIYRDEFPLSFSHFLETFDCE